jgi:hypothetical protein
MAAVAATVQVQSLGTVCVQGSSSRLLGGKPLCLAPLPSTATRGVSLVVRAGSGLPSPTKVNSFCPPPPEPALRFFFVSVWQSESRWNSRESANLRDFHIFRYFSRSFSSRLLNFEPEHDLSLELDRGPLILGRVFILFACLSSISLLKFVATTSANRE